MRNIISNDIFEEIVQNHYKLVYKIGIDVLKDSFEAENISQDTFISLYKNIDKYLHLDSDSLKKIICKIALNKCRDYLKRSEFKLVTSIDDVGVGSLKSDYLIEEELIKKERQLLIKKAINELKSPYNELISLYYISGLSLDEISEKMRKEKICY